MSFDEGFLPSSSANLPISQSTNHQTNQTTNHSIYQPINPASKFKVARSLALRKVPITYAYVNKVVSCCAR